MSKPFTNRKKSFVFFFYGVYWFSLVYWKTTYFPTSNPLGQNRDYWKCLRKVHLIQFTRFVFVYTFDCFLLKGSLPDLPCPFPRQGYSLVCYVTLVVVSDWSSFPLKVLEESSFWFVIASVDHRLTAVSWERMGRRPVWRCGAVSVTRSPTRRTGPRVTVSTLVGGRGRKVMTSRSPATADTDPSPVRTTTKDLPSP